jgi:hypothetical protein
MNGAGAVVRGSDRVAKASPGGARSRSLRSVPGTIHAPIAHLQQGSAKCPHCGRQIKPTPEFVAAIQVLK